MTTHCSVPTPLWKCRPMEGSAMPTTVASREAMPEPSTVAAMTQRPWLVPKESSPSATRADRVATQ